MGGRGVELWVLGGGGGGEDGDMGSNHPHSID